MATYGVQVFDEAGRATVGFDSPCITVDNVDLSSYSFLPHFVEMDGSTLVVSRYNGSELMRKSYTPSPGAAMTCCGVWGMTDNVAHVKRVLVFERYYG